MMDEGKRARPTTINNEMTNNEGIDRISRLHDSILTDILSRLDSKELVQQTCILSKRWTKLWTLVPCLNFHYYESEGIENENRDLERFETFVTLFLHIRDNAAELHSFSLSHKKSDSDLPKTWIDYALKHNVKKLCVVLEGCNGVHVPDCLFICESLEDVYFDLRFVEGREKIEMGKVYLPKLKKLSLCNVSLKVDYMEKLLVGCPALESLSLFSCDFEINNISSRTLKRLCINHCVLNNDWEPTTFTLCAPNLEYLDFGVCLGYDMVMRFKSLCNVREASISVQFLEDYNSHLFSGLPGLEDLQLESDDLDEMLKGELRDCPTFHSLKKLNLVDCCMVCAFSQLSAFLERCPNLENLFMRHFDNFCKAGGNHSLEEIKTFHCERLKKVEVKSFELYENTSFLIGLLSQSTKEIEGVKLYLELERIVLG